MDKNVKYDEVVHWNKRKNPNDKKVTQEMLEKYPIGFIRDNLLESENILDFGPGKGDMFSAYKNSNVKTVQGYDVSDLYKDYIEKEALKYSWIFKLDVVKEIKKLPYKDDDFDCGIVMRVLMHQRPTNIELVLTELMRCCKYIIVGTYWNQNGSFDTIETDKRKYNHDYKGLCEKYNWEMYNFQYGSVETFGYWCMRKNGKR